MTKKQISTFLSFAITCLIVGCQDSKENSSQLSVQREIDADNVNHFETSTSEFLEKPVSKPGVTRDLINKVASGPGDMYQVYDLMFDYDMARISEEDYQFLVEKISQAKDVQDAANRQSHLQSAYDAATGGDVTFSFNFDSQATFSTPQARLGTLKRIVDEARMGQTNRKAPLLP